MGLDWLLTVLLVIVVVGFVVWVVDKAPIDPTFKVIGKGLAILGLVVWLILEAKKFL